MSPQPAKPLTPEEVLELWDLFGPPPVLSSESHDGYTRLMAEYVAYYKPTNALQLRAIREAADADWESFRCNRHRTVAVERHFQKDVADRVSNLRHKNERRREEIEDIARRGGDADKKYKYQTLIQATETNIAKISQTPANELDHNRFLEQASEFLDHLDEWQNSAKARRAGALQLLEYSLSRDDADDQKIIDAQYQEVDKRQIGHAASPPIAPAETPDHDVTAENPSEPAKLLQE